MKVYLGLVSPFYPLDMEQSLWLRLFKGNSIRSESNDYDFEAINVDKESLLFNGLNDKLSLWLDREYVFNDIPEGFSSIGNINGKVLAIENRDRKFYGVKFNPEI